MPKEAHVLNHTLRQLWLEYMLVGTWGLELEEQRGAAITHVMSHVCEGASMASDLAAGNQQLEN